MIRLDVAVTLPTGERVPAGELVSFPERNPAQGAFRYTPEYLAHPRAFPVDPQQLPLKPGEFVTGGAGLHDVFEDALPDDWGRRILIRHHKVPRAEQTPAHLLAYLGDTGFGALRFGPLSGRAATPAVLDGTTDLPALVEASARYEAEDDPRGLEVLFRAGSGSAGGARPKAPVIHEGAAWLAKFPSRKDERCVVRIEAACMRLAAAAGLVVAETVLHEVGTYPVLLVRRFDVTEHGRRHMITLKTLLQAGGFYHVSYPQVADAVRRVSSTPSEDLPRLYRWMVFNVLVGNTDDHLKNFTMLHDETGWHLSPAYDLVADVAGNYEHVLSFGSSNYPPGRTELLALGNAFGLSPVRARAIYHEVHAALSGWREAFAAAGVPPADVDILARSIDRRLHAS